MVVDTDVRASERLFVACVKRLGLTSATTRASATAVAATIAWCALDLRGRPTQARSEFVGNDFDRGALVAVAVGVLTLLETTSDDDA